MRFLVVGAGGLGGFFGGMLLEGGAEVAFLVRPARAARLAERGLVVKTSGREFRRLVHTVQAGAIDGRYDVVLLACKAYDLGGAMDAIAPALGPGSAVLPVLNGVAHIAALTARLGREHVLGGMTTVNAHLSPEGEIHRFAETSGRTVFGELDGALSARCEAIRDALAAGGEASEVSPRILAEMWDKFTLFAAIAAIATLTRATAGEVAATAAGADFAAAAFDECARVTTAEGYPPPAATRELVCSLYGRVGSPYRPSMLVDLEAGRRTEGEHVIGDLVDRAERRRLPVPILRAARCALQAHEVQRTTTPASE